MIAILIFFIHATATTVIYTLSLHDALPISLLPRIPLVVARRVAFPVGSRWKYGRARRYIAVSEFVKSVLVAGGVPESKISVVYDGVPILEVSRGAEVLRLEKGKSPSNLEEALAKTAILVYLTDSEGLGSGALL